MYTNEINYKLPRHYQYKMQCVIDSLSTADTQYDYVNIML